MDVDWARLFTPDMPLLEIFVRGTIVYFSLFVLLRILRREAGTIGLADLLVIVLIADAAQNAMSGDYTSITDGLLLVVTIIAWNYVLDWVGFHVPGVGRFLHPPPLPLIDKGRMLRHNMRREFVSEDELMSHLREQGVDDVAQVRRAYIEGDGRISVMTYEGDHHAEEERSAGT